MLFRPKNNLYYITAQAQWGENAPDASRKGLFHRVDHTWTTPTPWIASSWVEHGPVDLTPHPGVGDGAQITAGVSLLLRDDVPGSPHYAFITTSNSAAALFVAESTVRHNSPLDRLILCSKRHKCLQDLLHWYSPRFWTSGRPGCYDEHGLNVASQVERLSNGNYIFLVSTDNRGRCPSATCERCGETSVNATCPYYEYGGCNIGWLILDAVDPTVIVARADVPFVWPELPSETVGPPGFPLQSPYVTFTTGLEPLGNDTFNVYFVSPIALSLRCRTCPSVAADRGYRCAECGRYERRRRTVPCGCAETRTGSVDEDGRK